MFFISLLLLNVFLLTTTQPLDQWLGNKYFDEKYLFEWKKDDINEELTVRITVRTKGWVGFGFSSYGKFESSDMVIGWITPEGKTQFHDRWADRPEETVIDKSQDWYLINSMENSTHTMFEMKRVYKPCDTLEDIEVSEKEKQNIIWAYSETDPTDQLVIQKADVKGVKHIRLLDPIPDPVEPTESDLELYDFTFNDIKVPETKGKVVVLCKLVKVPFTQPRHIVKCGPRNEPAEARRFVYHSSILTCDPQDPEFMDKHVGEWFESHDIPEAFKTNMSCVYATPCSTPDPEHMYYAPPEAGIQMGGGNRFSTYFLVSVHVENHHHEKGQVFTHKMRTWHTGQLRKHNLEFISLMAKSRFSVIGFAVILPPRQPRFELNVISTTHCFEHRMDPNGIIIDATFTHGHANTREFYVRHFRGDKELQPIITIKHFDYKYNVKEKLNRKVVLMPGDKILSTCVYNTSMDAEVNLGEHELCQTAMTFYPGLSRQNFTYMGKDQKEYDKVLHENTFFMTGLTYEDILNISQVKKIDGFYGMGEPIIREPAELNGTTLYHYLRNKREWIPAWEIEQIMTKTKKRHICAMGCTNFPPTRPEVELEMPSNYIPYVDEYKQCKLPMAVNQKSTVDMKLSLITKLFKNLFHLN